MVTGMPPGIAMETGIHLQHIPLANAGVSVTTMGGGLPQFEPVSPDENEHAPTSGVGGTMLMSRDIPLTTQHPVYVTATLCVCLVSD